MGYCDSDDEDVISTPLRKQRLKERPCRWLCYALSLSFAYVVYVFGQSAIAQNDPLEAKLSISVGNFLMSFLIYLFQFSRRKIKKGHFVKLRHSFFFAHTHDHFELRTFLLIHLAIVLNGAGTVLLGYSYYYAAEAEINMGLTTA